jgi:hypothetical protein
MSEKDFDLITVTDDVQEVVDTMKKHRSWKQEMIDKARKK